MGKNNKIYIRDFIIVKGKYNQHHFADGYTKISISTLLSLFYRQQNSFSFSHFVRSKNKIEIKWANVFYPLFRYQLNDLMIITPNYSHLFALGLPLSIAQNKIAEFIIFNTTLQNHTLHNEVERLFEVENIIIEKDQIHVKYSKETENDKPVFDVFIEYVNSIIKNVKPGRHGVFLSGGNESRINAAVAIHYDLGKTFFTWGHPQDKEFLIAQKISKTSKTEHINIRSDASNLPYKEFLVETGFLANMQYAYRYLSTRLLFEKYNMDYVWTGWGDINGYLPLNISTELFSDYFWRRIQGSKIYTRFWNKDFLCSYDWDRLGIPEQSDRHSFLKFLFQLKTETITPRIFGQVLSAEQLHGTVIAPWFNKEIYETIMYLEEKSERLYLSKPFRVLWQNHLYTRLLSKYDTRLNYIKNAKNYYPFLFNKYLKYPGLPLSFILKKFGAQSSQFFDPVEDKIYLRNELEKVESSGNPLFNKHEVQEIICTVEKWNGPTIMELFKIIQIYWLFKKVKDEKNLYCKSNKSMDG